MITFALLTLCLFCWIDTRSGPWVAMLVILWLLSFVDALRGCVILFRRR